MLKLIDFQGFRCAKIKVLREQIRSYLWKLFATQSHTSVYHWSMPDLAEFLACLCNYNKMYIWNNAKMGCWNLASKILRFSRFSRIFQGFSRFHIHFQGFFQGFVNLRQIQGFQGFSRFSRLAINPVDGGNQNLIL